MPGEQVAARIAHHDEESRTRGRLFGQHAGGDQFLAEARWREHEAVVRECVRLRGVPGPRGGEDRRELAVGLDAHGERRDRRTISAANRCEKPGDRTALTRWAEHGELRLGKRAHELRRAVECEIEPLAKRAGTQPLSAARGILRCEHDSRAVDDPERDHALRRQRRLHRLSEILGLGGAASWRGALTLGIRRQTRSALDHHRILRHARGFGGVLAHPHVESLDDGAEQRLEARDPRLGDRIAHAVVGPVAEPDEKPAHDHRRRVAPGLGLDEVRDDVRDRVGGGFGIARANVEYPRLRRRAFGRGLRFAGHPARSLAARNDRRITGRVGLRRASSTKPAGTSCLPERRSTCSSRHARWTPRDVRTAGRDRPSDRRSAARRQVSSWKPARCKGEG